MATLVVLSGKAQGQVFDLSQGDTFEVGTARKAQIHLRDRGVSYQHAKVVKRDGRYFLQDGGSPQGTSLNKKRVTSEQLLGSGDVLGVGEIELRFEDVAAVAVKPAAPPPPPTSVTISMPDTPIPEPFSNAVDAMSDPEAFLSPTATRTVASGMAPSRPWGTLPSPPGSTCPQELREPHGARCNGEKA